MALLARLLRSDLESTPGARAILFAGSEDHARQLAEPLRKVLWAEHRLAVLLPSGPL